MVSLSSSARLLSAPIFFPTISRAITTSNFNPNPNPNPNPSPHRITFISREITLNNPLCSSGNGQRGLAVSNICEQEPLGVDLTSPSVEECFSDEELHAAVRLRIRTFNNFNQSCGVEDYQRFLTEGEYDALKERIAGKRIQFKRVSCINATLPSLTSLQTFPELCSSCKFANDDGKDCVVVGTLDVNQCYRLADELIGKKPEGNGADLARGYLSNVCVAKELQRNGLGYALVSKSKNVALHWGITDLYVHVAVDNEAAQRLYEKLGFLYESEEPAWQARFLGRPRRFLLWADLRQTD